MNQKDPRVLPLGLEARNDSLPHFMERTTASGTPCSCLSQKPWSPRRVPRRSWRKERWTRGGCREPPLTNNFVKGLPSPIRMHHAPIANQDRTVRLATRAKRSSSLLLNQLENFLSKVRTPFHLVAWVIATFLLAPCRTHNCKECNRGFRSWCEVRSREYTCSQVSSNAYARCTLQPPFFVHHFLIILRFRYQILINKSENISD